MDQAVKAQWTEALRSGEYEQETSQLCFDGRYCCLGVLCELAIKAGLDIAKEISGSEVYYDGESAILPDAVKEWAGLEFGNPRVSLPELGVLSLAELNDGRTPDERQRSFPEIADLIDAHL